MLGITDARGSQIDKKLNKKYDLTNNTLVSKANRTIKKLVDGKGFGTIKNVKDSTALAAAGMIYDRVQPVVKQNLNLNVNTDITPVDLRKYMPEVSDE